MRQNKNYYRILNINENASTYEVRHAYKKLSLKYHPDKVACTTAEDHEKAKNFFQTIGEAYEVLINEEKKSKHDILRNLYNHGENNEIEISGLITTNQKPLSFYKKEEWKKALGKKLPKIKFQNTSFTSKEIEEFFKEILSLEDYQNNVFLIS